MSLALFLEEHFSAVFLNTDHFATSMIRYVDGENGNSKTIVGIVTVRPAEPDDMRGRGYVHRCELLLLENVTITATDAIKYEGNRYEIESVGDAEHGIRMVQLIRYQPESQGGRPLKTGDH